MNLVPIILAAGKSSRMGRAKLLLPWGNTSVLGKIIRLWSQLPTGQIAVVHASGDALVESELDRLGFSCENRIVNPEPERGMFSSIRCAARWTGWDAAVTHFAIVLGDQPHLKIETLKTIADFAARNPNHICQPSWKGHGRHPVILPVTAFRAIAETDAPDLKSFLQSRANEMALLEMDDAALDMDLDTPADYEAALKMFPPGA